MLRFLQQTPQWRLAAVLTNSGRVDGAAVKVATVHEGQHTFDCVKAFVVLSHHKRWERCGLEI